MCPQPSCPLGASARRSGTPKRARRSAHPSSARLAAARPRPPSRPHTPGAAPRHRRHRQRGGVRQQHRQRGDVHHPAQHSELTCVTERINIELMCVMGRSVCSMMRVIRGDNGVRPAPAVTTARPQPRVARYSHRPHHRPSTSGRQPHPADVKGISRGLEVPVIGAVRNCTDTLRRWTHHRLNASAVPSNVSDVRRPRSQAADGVAAINVCYHIDSNVIVIMSQVTRVSQVIRRIIPPSVRPPTVLALQRLHPRPRPLTNVSVVVCRATLDAPRACRRRGWTRAPQRALDRR